MADLIDREAAMDALAKLVPYAIYDVPTESYTNGLTDAYNLICQLPSAQQWIPCSERLPKEYGEYRITWVTSYAPSKRFRGDSEYEVTNVWDEERNDFKGEWLLDDYIKHYPDVKVIAWKPLEEPYKGERK